MVKLLLQKCCFIADLRRGVDTIFLILIVSCVLNILIAIASANDEKMGIFGKVPTIIFAVLITVTSSLSLLGLSKENRFYLLPWIVTVIIIIIGNIVLICGIVYYPENFKTSVYDIPMIAITTCIFVYCFMCVFSLYCKMSDREYKAPYDQDSEEQETL